MNIVSIVGARPNFIKLAPIHSSLTKISKHTIIHTGQHYDYNLTKIFFKELDIPNPDFNLEVGSGNASTQIGQMITKLEPIFENNKFDLAIVYGDTNSTLAGAIAANKSSIKLAHVESGLRSFDRKMPEEINRSLTDCISDLLFAPTDNSIINLKRENISGQIFNTGDIAVEIINKLKSLNKSTILKRLDLMPKGYILLTMHRAENTNIPSNLKTLIQTIQLLKEYEIIFPIHPRTLSFFKKTNLLYELEQLQNIKIIEPLGYIDFINLMKHSDKIITDSGGIQKESFLLEVPCITIRNNTEWIETVNLGWNLLTGLDSNKVLEGVKNWIPQKQKSNFLGNGKTSEVITEIINDNLKT